MFTQGVAGWSLLSAALLFGVAANCETPPPTGPAHGTSPLSVRTSVNNVNPVPGGSPGPFDAAITGGVITVTPPAGDATTIDVPEGGLVLAHDIPVTDANFAGASSPYGWTATCTLHFTASQPPGGTRVSRGYPFYWAANVPRTIFCQLELVDLNHCEPTTGAPTRCIPLLVWQARVFG